jgi:hypothetical protein
MQLPGEHPFGTYLASAVLRADGIGAGIGKMLAQSEITEIGNHRARVIPYG